MDLAGDVYHELTRRYPHTKMEKVRRRIKEKKRNLIIDILINDS